MKKTKKHRKLIVIIFLVIGVVILLAASLFKWDQHRGVSIVKPVCSDSPMPGRIVVITNSDVSRAEVDYLVKPVKGTVIKEIKGFNQYEISVPRGNEQTDVGILRTQPGMYKVYQPTVGCSQQN